MVFFREVFNPGNYFLNPYAMPNIVIGVYCFFLGVFALLKKRSKGLSLCLMTFSTGIYFLFFALSYLSLSPYLAYWFIKISYFMFGVPFIATSTYLFSLEITGMINDKRERLLLYSGYLIMVISSILIAFTQLIIEFPPTKYFWGYSINIGPLHPFFLALWIGFALKGEYNVYRAYRKERDPLEKNKLKVFFYVYLFGYIGAVDFMAPYAPSGMKVYPFGYLPAAAYITLLIYNFIRYKALGVETVVHKTLLWIGSVLLIILPIGILEVLLLQLTARFNILINIAIACLILTFFAYYYFYLRPRIDRLFGKKQYDYYELLGRISAEVSTTLDIEEFSRRLLDELDACILPQKIYFWVINEDKQDYFLFAEKTSMQATHIYKERREFLSGEEAIVSHLRATKEILEPPIVFLNPEFYQLKNSLYFSFLQRENVEALVPLTMEDKLIGILGLGRKQSLRIYAKQDLEILSTLGRELGTSFYNALHHKDIVEKERLAEELKLGRDIQVALLPRENPRVQALTVQGLMQPAKEIGGDYYDFITRPDNENFAVVIGDVSGKGVAAGILMSMVKAIIHTLSQEGFLPREILLRTNQFLNQHIGGQKFMTLLYLLWQPGAKNFIYSSAGHEHILIYRDSIEDLEVIQSGGFMLGMIADIGNFLEEKQIQLQPCDKILLYTDGVTEAENQDRDRFGLDRLKASFKKYSKKPANELMLAIKKEVYMFIGTHPQYDDITLVVMEAT